MEVTNDAILERLVTSDAGKQAAADLLREATAERIKLTADIEKLKRERGEQRAMLSAETTAMRAKLDTARTALTKAESAYNAAAQKEATTVGQYDGRIQRLEARLLATAPGSISAFITEMDDLASEAKATVALERRRPTDKINTHNGNLIHEVWTNAASLRERLDAIRNAITEAQKLKTRVLADDVLAERLDELRDSLPPVEMRYSHEA
jgi:SMC interacting uncharacterized protein involved in chromosome segregation